MSSLSPRKNIVFDPSNYNLFNISNLVITRPILNTSRCGRFTWVSSDGGYLDENGGDVCNLIITAPKRTISGFNEKYAPGTDHHQRTPEKIRGYYIVYTLTDIDNVTNPTDSDRMYKSILDAIHSKVCDVLTSEMDESSSVLPVTTLCAFVKARKNSMSAVKPLYSSPDPTERQPNPPSVQHIECTTLENGDGTITPTTVVKSSRESKSVLNYVNTTHQQISGIIEPKILLGEKCVYWGVTGSHREFGASIILKLFKCRFEPRNSMVW